jgi:hypothetical protein
MGAAAGLPLGLALVQALRFLDARRPAKAADVLASIAGRLQGDDQRRVHRDLVARAQSLRAEGVLELDD